METTSMMMDVHRPVPSLNLNNLMKQVVIDETSEADDLLDDQAGDEGVQYDDEHLLDDDRSYQHRQPNLPMLTTIATRTMTKTIIKTPNKTAMQTTKIPMQTTKILIKTAKMPMRQIQTDQKMIKKHLHNLP